MREYAVQFLITRDDGDDGGGLSPPLHIEADNAAEALLKAVDKAKAEWAAQGDNVKDPESKEHQ